MLREPSKERQAELAQLGGPDFRRRLRFGPRDRSIEILPGLRADSPEFLGLTAELSDELERLMPRSKTSNGLFLDTAIPGGWSKIRNVTGYSMDPEGSPTGQQPDEVPRRFYSADDEQLLRFVVRELTKNVVARGFSTRKLSSSGHPHYSKNVEVKRGLLINGAWALQSSEGQKAIMTGDLRTLARNNCYFASTKASRFQADPPGKERHAYNWHGKRVVADKRLDLGGRADIPPALRRFLKTHWRTRGRVAYSISGAINYAHQTAADGVRHGMYLRFPKTYHFRDPGTQEEQLDPTKPYPVTWDMKQFDQQQALMVIDAFIDELPLTDPAKQSLRYLVRCPVFINSDVRAERGGRWLGDPLDPTSFTAEHGNISGWVWNDILNACVGTWVALLALRSIGIWTQRGDWQQVVVTILEWRHPAAAINNKGDDTVMWFADPAMRAKLAGVVTRPGRPLYFEIELEDGAQFLGSVFVTQGSRIRLLPNLASFVINVLVTEYSAGDVHRPYPSFGYVQRKTYYGRHPLFTLADATVEALSRRHLGASLNDIAQASMVNPPPEPGYDTYAAQTFLTNPAATFYKIDPSALPKTLFTDTFMAIPAEEAWPLFGLPILVKSKINLIDQMVA